MSEIVIQGVNNLNVNDTQPTEENGRKKCLSCMAIYIYIELLKFVYTKVKFTYTIILSQKLRDEGRKYKFFFRLNKI